MQLTSKDIKTIKYEKRPGFVFSASIIVIGILINLIYLTNTQNRSNGLLILIDPGIIGLSVLVLYLMNRKYNLDLKAGEKIIRHEIVQQKERKIDYEAGSGTLDTPILSALFPKQFGQKMREVSKTNLIINGFRYEVDNTLFDNVNQGDTVEMYYSIHSETLLGIEKKYLSINKSQAIIAGSR